MQRDVQHGGIGFEHVLRAVAVVDVVVHDRDSLRAVSARVGGRDRDVVEQAEAHRAAALGMVAGRPHHREHRVHGRCGRPANGLSIVPDSSPAPPHRRRRRPRAARSHATRPTCTCPDRARRRGRPFPRSRDVLRRVHPSELLGGRRVRGGDLVAPRPRLRGDDLHHLGPLGALGMPGRRPMLGEALGGDEGQRHENVLGSWRLGARLKSQSLDRSLDLLLRVLDREHQVLVAAMRRAADDFHAQIARDALRRRVLGPDQRDDARLVKRLERVVAARLRTFGRKAVAPIRLDESDSRPRTRRRR